MRNLTVGEVDSVNGGVIPVVAAITIIGAVFAFGYGVGKDMAARDNAREK